jgi:hypothetical protein
MRRLCCKTRCSLWRRSQGHDGRAPDPSPTLLYEFSLERHVPDDHLLRSIARFVDSATSASSCGNTGRPSVESGADDQDADFRLLHGLRSERRHIRTSAGKPSSAGVLRRLRNLRTVSAEPAMKSEKAPPEAEKVHAPILRILRPHARGRLGNPLRVPVLRQGDRETVSRCDWVVGASRTRTVKHGGASTCARFATRAPRHELHAMLARTPISWPAP